MKKWIMAGSIILLVLTTWWIRIESNDNKLIFLVQEGQSRCHTIHFNQPNERSLEVQNDIMVIPFDKNGNFKTSSSSSLLTGLGGYKEVAYYVNDQGERLKEIVHEKYLNASLNSHGSKETYTLSFDGSENHCY